jgi:hypothetical protein
MKKYIKSSQKSQESNSKEENTKKFLKHVKRMCKEHNITLDLRRATKVTLSEQVKCSGYFCDDTRVLAVAMKHEDALGLLVHEFCHLTQWLDHLDGKFRRWKTAGHALGKIDNWLAGEPVTNIKRAITYARDLELDNEMRAVAMIKEWDLPIDIADYTRKANAYVLFYNWLHKTRRWSVPPNTPYSNPAVLGVMSNKFNMKYTTLSRTVLRAFKNSGV